MLDAWHSVKFLSSRFGSMDDVRCCAWIFILPVYHAALVVLMGIDFGV